MNGQKKMDSGCWEKCKQNCAEQHGKAAPVNGQKHSGSSCWEKCKQECSSEHKKEWSSEK
ncbi:TPA: hypothetical protein DDZ86_02465 [Candidatus Dependentiae bacterium]|nr:MAG: hypothetical protein UW09_C0001G0155 [candidate division TM6 bacterium GW2011_GWF2_43_87]HBL98482.1 hypothetical protein [Candidatus Dependentiae bacterium]